MHFRTCIFFVFISLSRCCFDFWVVWRRLDRRRGGWAAVWRAVVRTGSTAVVWRAEQLWTGAVSSEWVTPRLACSPLLSSLISIDSSLWKLVASLSNSHHVALCFFFLFRVHMTQIFFCNCLNFDVLVSTCLLNVNISPVLQKREPYAQYSRLKEKRCVTFKFGIAQMCDLRYEANKKIFCRQLLDFTVLFID